MSRAKIVMLKDEHEAVADGRIPIVVGVPEGLRTSQIDLHALPYTLAAALESQIGRYKVLTGSIGVKDEDGKDWSVEITSEALTLTPKT